MSKIEKNFRIVATDGTNTKEVMWIRHTGNELFLGQILDGMDCHHSYHNDGTYHFKMKHEDEKKPHYPFPDEKLMPLNNFTGQKQLFMMDATSEDILQNSIHDYIYSKYDDVIFIDLRNCREGHFVISAHLIEPNRLDLIKPDFFGNKTHMHVLTSVNPWLVILSI